VDGVGDEEGVLLGVGAGGILCGRHCSSSGNVVLGDNLGMRYERDGTCDVRMDMIYTWAFYVGSTEVVSSWTLRFCRCRPTLGVWVVHQLRLCCCRHIQVVPL
jgi:hypothetical protein